MHAVLFIQDLAVVLAVAAAVGWLCQRAGLSSVVGFLVSGILVGPASPLFPLVPDTGGIETLAQVGLVFLMFSIGLRLSLRRLRRMGPALLGAASAGAVLMYHASRLLAASFGWSFAEGLFLAGMLMVSSSSIIGRVVQESGVAHERAGQLALGVSVLEDVVAVAMLGLLESVVQLGGVGSGGGAGLGPTVLRLGAFVALICVGGLIVVPWLLRRMSASVGEELQTIVLAALLFGLAVIARKAGYSLALGAFLLGIIVAETPHRHQVERSFEGMRDVFTAVFFVAIGMEIDVHDLADSAGLIAGVAAFTLLARPVCVSAGLCLVGVPARDAARAGLMTSPIGEFSFVIAQLGVGAAVVPARFYPLAVGVSLLTTLAAPFMARQSGRVVSLLAARQPEWFGDWLSYYHDWIGRLARQGRRSPLWQLSRSRIAQVGVEVLFVSGILVFARPLEAAAEGWLGRDWLFPGGTGVAFWTLLTLVVLPPLVAIWRNCSALALLFAQVSTGSLPRAAQLARLVEAGIKTMVAALMVIWLTSVVPEEATTRWLLLGSAVVAVGALLFLRRKLILWHGLFEVELRNAMHPPSTKPGPTSAPWLARYPDWDLHIADSTLPDLADCQGKSLAELDLRARFGCSVVGIERQGFMIALPTPQSVLYPRDKVLLMGTLAQLEAGRRFLGAVSGALDTDSLFAEVGMEAVVVPEEALTIGRTLGDIAPARNYGVQIAGLRRGAVRILNPGATEALAAGDELLVLGAPEAVARFRGWVEDRSEAGDPS